MATELTSRRRHEGRIHLHMRVILFFILVFGLGTLLFLCLIQLFVDVVLWIGPM